MIYAILGSYALPLLADTAFSDLLMTKYSTTFQIGIYYVAAFLISILGGLLSIGVAFMNLNIARNLPVDGKQLFHCYRNNTDRYILAYAVYAVLINIAQIPFRICLYYYNANNWEDKVILIVILCLISLVLNTIISVIYGLLFYTLLDRPELGPIQSLRSARQAIRGHKGRYFYMILSFIGMELLGILSLGIGLLWGWWSYR